MEAVRPKKTKAKTSGKSQVIKPNPLQSFSTLSFEISAVRPIPASIGLEAGQVSTVHHRAGQIQTHSHNYVQFSIQNYFCVFCGNWKTCKTWKLHIKAQSLKTIKTNLHFNVCTVVTGCLSHVENGTG